MQWSLKDLFSSQFSYRSCKQRKKVWLTAPSANSSGAQCKGYPKRISVKCLRIYTAGFWKRLQRFQIAVQRPKALGSGKLIF